MEDDEIFDGWKKEDRDKYETKGILSSREPKVLQDVTIGDAGEL